MFSGKLGPTSLATYHVRHRTSYGMKWRREKGASVTAHVTNTRPKRLSLIQGGLEILIIVTVEKNNADGIKILKERV